MSFKKSKNTFLLGAFIMLFGLLIFLIISGIVLILSISIYILFMLIAGYYDIKEYKNKLKVKEDEIQA